MLAVVKPHVFSGTVRVPPSKSHTIRRLLLASATEGESLVSRPLESLDASSCLSVCRNLWADIEEIRSGGVLTACRVRGRAPESLAAGKTCDVGNSGTTLFLCLAMAALGKAPVTFTGDEQIQRRSAGPLLAALSSLGAELRSAPGGCAPITVRGPWKGGRVSVECPTSQYLSALLLAAPLAPEGVVTEIDVPLLNEKPYIEMTLSYLDRGGVRYEKAADFSSFTIPGGQKYRVMNGPVSGDFSSAAFPLCAAALSGGTAELLGLDRKDSQGDKKVVSMLETMGCSARWEKAEGGEEKLVLSRRFPLKGAEFDLNDTPDLLPVMAVCAACAEGVTVLGNAASARIKETDRIAVMREELATLGVTCEEKPDALIVYGGGLHGGVVDSRGDHRVAMALAVAGLAASSPVSIRRAECADVTYPGFLALAGAETREEA